MYTIEDILALPEGKHAELLDGEMFMMSSPTVKHQDVAGWFFYEICNHIRRRQGQCRVYQMGLGVFLMRDEKNYVEPDVSVICDREKLEPDGCHGAPDWIIEIVSPSSKKMDYKRKLAAYEKA
ncbi:MAG: Uma2 family endonuclease, partial [Roseburia sp.]|nr:Uma2 family endonuclease [Roseburia sp.]